MKTATVTNIPVEVGSPNHRATDEAVHALLRDSSVLRGWQDERQARRNTRRHALLAQARAVVDARSAALAQADELALAAELALRPIREQYFAAEANARRVRGLADHLSYLAGLQHAYPINEIAELADPRLAVLFSWLQKLIDVASDKLDGRNHVEVFRVRQGLEALCERVRAAITGHVDLPDDCAPMIEAIRTEAKTSLASLNIREIPALDLVTP